MLKQYEVKLLRKTDSIALKSECPAFVTFYKGTPDLKYFENKVKDIVNYNLWLETKVIKKGKDFYLEYTNQPKHQSFSVITLPELKYELQYSDKISKALGKYKIKHGHNHVINTSESLFRVMIIIISDEIFGLFFSVSHGLADGNTAYQLYGMLDKNTPASSLVVERNDQYESIADQVISRKDGRWVQSFGFILNILSNLMTGSKKKSYSRLVNASYIKEMKNSFNTETSYISTNDILTSKLSSIMHSDETGIVINFRGKSKFEQITFQMAGNYIRSYWLQSSDYKDPRDVRTCLQSLGRKSGDLPGFWKTFRSKLVVFTNWASLYKNVSLDGCEQLCHLPVYDPRKQMLPHVVIIYKSTVDKIAITIISKHMETMLKENELHRILS